MSNYTNPDGRNFTIPNYSDLSNGPDNFKAFAATMPSYGSEIMMISAGDAAYEQKHLSRVLWFQFGGEYTLNDSAPVGAQVSIATSGGFVSIMTDGVSAEPAQERLIRPYSIVTCTKIANGMWLVAKGSGAAGQYFNEATGGTVTEIADYNGSGELWRVHTLTGNNETKAFTVTSGTQPFRVMVQGGGGATGYHGSNGNNKPGSGGCGEHYYNATETLTAGTYDVIFGTIGGHSSRGQTVNLDGVKSCIGGSPGGSGDGGNGGSGGGGGGGGGQADPNWNGGPTGSGGAGANGCFNGAAGQFNNTQGGGGGAGGHASGGTGGIGVTRDITGTSVRYADGGGRGGGSGYGRGSSAGGGWESGSGPGIVIVAYQIG